MAPLWGIADLHCHPMAHLAFGGDVLAGLPDDPEHPNSPQGIARALARCEPVPHGPFGVGNLHHWNIAQAFIESGLGHGPCGHGSFGDWPLFHTRAHQQMFVEWIRRAVDGGLRLMCAVMLNNELLGTTFGHDRKACRDRVVVQAQVEALESFVGRHSDFMGLATSPAQARTLIEAGKLAIVMGIEVDSLDGILGDRPGVTGTPLTPADLPRILDTLWDWGIRMMNPIHLANNSFGGSSIYSDLFNLSNFHLNGEFFEVVSNPTVDFRLGEDRDLQVQLAIATTHLSDYPRATYAAVPHGHSNARGLDPLGAALVQAAMARGFIVDLEHMSERATDATLALAEAKRYPVVSSHGEFRALAIPKESTSLMTKRCTEHMKTAVQVRRILGGGGLVAPVTNQWEVKTFDPAVPNDCARSAKSWAQSYLYAIAQLRDFPQGGVAVGTDFNGLNEQPGPRFGPHAAAGLDNEWGRWSEQARQKEAQRLGKGVSYGGEMTYPREWTGRRAPLDRLVAGTRSFDVNTDGLACYGLLPDFVADLAASGVPADKLTPLFQSAEAFVRMWERCGAAARGD